MSDATRASKRHVLDIAYGADGDERLDIFFPASDGKPMPVHIFIHGGYWRANRKEDYAFVAESICAGGAIAVVIEYSLMPKVRMAHIVKQVRRAADWVSGNIAGHGGDPSRLSASGHSAGAHLASYLGARGPHETAPLKTPVRSLLLVSGLYQLEPLTKSFLQAEIGLTQQEVDRWSPYDAQPVEDIKATLVVGEDETEPFHKQAEDYATLRAARGTRARRFVLPGLNHMSIISEMGNPQTVLASLVAETIARS
ncbi:alpha/beta hydrolase [Rhizobium sp. KVB221]|uniref:Alpha/beta hydrolase n=2 Tax=Rhizobium setariae TaxID=2801340 RepID=A0A937CLW4_9HYPH|nr:alpha/beta hydrolase [Rhizobium setariae]